MGAKLISSNPSLLDKRRSIILPIGLGLRAVVVRVTICFESFLMVRKPSLMVFILTKLYVKVNEYKYST